jgi:NTE family protein
MNFDQVVLGSGGVLGDTWMSALTAGLLEAGGPDLRQARHLVGTSAGSIVATRLAAGKDLRDYIERRFSANQATESEDGQPELLLVEAHGEKTGRGPLAAAASGLLSVSRPAGSLLRRIALRAVPEGRQELSRLGETIDRLMPQWDPRLSLVGVDARRGSRVVLQAEADLGLSVSQAVRASCAIPGVFRPVESERGPIVDGGVWSPVNLDAVRAASGSAVLCLYPSGYRSAPGNFRRSAATTVSRARVSLEVATVRRAGSRVLVVTPGAASVEAIGPSRMDHRRDAAVAAAGYQQGLDLAGPLGDWLDGARSQKAVQP